MKDKTRSARQSVLKQAAGNYEGLTNQISALYSKLSPRNQEIARYVTQNPNTIAMESAVSIAKLCGAHPSSLVRFAQIFGFDGFKDLQALFRTRLATAAPGFNERVAALETELRQHEGGGDYGILKDLVISDIASLHTLLDSVRDQDLGCAAEILLNARTIYIAGQLRSEPVARFVRYLLTMIGCRTILLDETGGLATERARLMEPGDALFAVSFRCYAKEVVNISEIAYQNGVPVIALTDSSLSPLAKSSKVIFEIPEGEYIFSRSLAAPMCLTLSLVTALARRLQPNNSEPAISVVTETNPDTASQ